MELNVDRGRIAERCARSRGPDYENAAGSVGLRKLSLGLVVLCRLAIAATGLGWLAEDNHLWAAVAAVALAITVVPVALLPRSHLRDATRLVLAVLVAAHVVVGMKGALYETSASYDKWAHLLGSGALAALGILAVRVYAAKRRVELPLPLLVLMALSGTLSIGALWELFEFGVDRTGLFTSQRGLDDTMLDLLADAAGASLVTLTFAAWVTYRRSSQGAGEPKVSPRRPEEVQ